MKNSSLSSTKVVGKFGITKNAKLIQQLEGIGTAFVLVSGKTPIEKGWQAKPRTAQQALSHKGNVGVLTGKPSDGIVAIDIDEGAQEFLTRYKYLQDTMWITRSDAPHRVKVFVRVTDSLPRSSAWVRDGRKAPSAELLSTGRQGIIMGTHTDGASYDWNGYLPKPITFAQLSSVWRGWTGKELNSPTRVKAVEKVSDNLYALAAKAHWDCMGVFEYFGMASTIVPKNDGNKKLRGNGGLFVEDDHSVFFCHSSQIGGDAIDAWFFAKHGEKISNKQQFTDTCNEMLEAIGEKLPFIKRDLGFDPATALLWAANPQTYPVGRRSPTLRSIMLAFVKTAIAAHSPIITFSVRLASEKAGIGYIAALKGLRELVALNILKRVNRDQNPFDAFTYSIKHLSDMIPVQSTSTTSAMLDINSETCVMDPDTLSRYADCDAFQHGAKIEGTQVVMGRAMLDVIAALVSQNDQSLKEIARCTSRSEATCTEKLKTLVDLGLIEEYKDGKRFRYYLVSAWSDILEPITGSVTTLGRTIKRKIKYTVDRINMAQKVLRWTAADMVSTLQEKIDGWRSKVQLFTLQFNMIMERN